MLVYKVNSDNYFLGVVLYFHPVPIRVILHFVIRQISEVFVWCVTGKQINSKVNISFGNHNRLVVCWKRSLGL